MLLRAPSSCRGYPGGMVSPSGEGPRSGRRSLLQGSSVGGVVGFVMAVIVQTIFPALAAVPGRILCWGDSFELVLRRKTSFGVCGDGEVIHYAVVLGVSWVVWFLVITPMGMLAFRMLRSDSKPPSP
jgi:hypothetical protein